jgi:hypothetical protein
LQALIWATSTQLKPASLGDFGLTLLIASRKMEYLYALVLAHAQKFNAAADHVTTYLKLAPGASDAAEAQKRLVQFQGLASSAGTR